MEFLLSFLAIACAVFVIFQVWTKQPSMKTGEKVIWSIAALFFSIITAIVYYFVKMK